MAGVPKHDIHEAAARPLRRGRAAAWLVFLGMAATTMAFQTYHSLHNGQMPWPLAYLYGIVPLGISIGVLIFAAVWPSKAGRAGAYLITAGAMYMSASATGTVTLHASSPHAELLFGFLLDGAALLAIRFIFDGPTAANAVAEVARREAELTTQRDAERSARERDSAAHQAAVSDLRARAGTEIGVRDQALADAAEALATARSDAEKAAAKTAVLERKLGGPARRSNAAPARSGTAPRSGTGTAPEDDLDLEARALKLLATNLDMSGAELAEKLGISAGYGRKLRRRLTGDRPSESEQDRSEDRTGTAPEDRSEDRA
jgi:hypothetical protein